MAQPRALCLIGDSYHDPARIERMLSDVLPLAGMAWDSHTDPLAAPWDALAGYDILLMAAGERLEPRITNEVWTTPYHERTVREFVSGGGGLVSLHAGLAHRPGGAFAEVARGRFLFHPAEHPLYTVHPDAGAFDWFGTDASFSLRDEMYFVKVDSASTRVLMHSRCDDYGSSPAAWAHEYGKGRVFAFTPGHNTGVMENPAYRRILGRGLDWCLGKF